MKQLLSVSVVPLLFGVALLPLATARAEQPVEMNTAAPEFKAIHEWINSKSLQLKELRGKVVVLHFWTFG
jgi:hypothetical protein